MDVYLWRSEEGKEAWSTKALEAMWPGDSNLLAVSTAQPKYLPTALLYTR